MARESDIVVQLSGLIREAVQDLGMDCMKDWITNCINDPDEYPSETEHPVGLTGVTYFELLPRYDLVFDRRAFSYQEAFIGIQVEGITYYFFVTDSHGMSGGDTNTHYCPSVTQADIELNANTRKVMIDRLNDANEWLEKLPSVCSTQKVSDRQVRKQRDELGELLRE